MRLQHKVIVVTGASRGIGQAICAAFAREGATVVGVARSDLAETAGAVQKAGRQFVAVNADLGKSSQGDARELVSQILRQTGRIDGLVGFAEAHPHYESRSARRFARRCLR